MKELNKFLKQNKGIDIGAVNLLKLNVVDSLNWAGIESRDATLSKLKGYQRLYKAVPETKRKHQIISGLLKKGIHSSTQIAALPRKHFLSNFANLFKNEKLAKETYSNAVAVRTNILLHFMENVQNHETQANNRSNREGV